MSGFELTVPAQRDIREILAHIAAANPAATTKVRQNLETAFVRLGKRPALGHARPDLTDRPVRFWTVMGRYLVVYRPDRTPIEIVRVFGPGRDVTALLR